MLCKKCGKEMECGYGLAGGSGIGPYFYCEDCNIMIKFQDPEMENPKQDK